MPSGPVMLTDEAGCVTKPRKSSMICGVDVSLKYSKEGSPKLAVVLAAASNCCNNQSSISLPLTIETELCCLEFPSTPV